MRNNWSRSDGEGWSRLLAWGELLCRACETENSLPAGQAEADLRARAASLWEELEEATLEKTAAGEFSPLAYVSAVFGLSAPQAQCLALALLSEAHRDFSGRCRRLDGGGEGLLTLGLALWLLGGPGMPGAGLRRALSPEGEFMALCMEPAGRRSGPRLATPLRAARRLAGFILDGAWEEPGTAGLSLIAPSWEDTPDRLRRTALQMERYLTSGGMGGTVFALAGQQGAGRRTLAGALAARLGGPLLLADGRALLRPGAGDFRLAVERECILQQCPLCVTGLEDALEMPSGDGEDEVWEEDLCRLLTGAARTGGCAMMLCREGWRPRAMPSSLRAVPVALPLPELEESKALWAELLSGAPCAVPQDPDRLAGSYRFTPGQMKQAVEDALALARWRGLSGIDDSCMAQGCRGQLHHALGDKARKVERLFTWDDLILPPGPKSLLRAACSQMKHRRQVYGAWGFSGRLPYGQGLSMLFSGPPGTGKTMAAQIAAGELGLELYKVELSAVVSKYVGETEKNLNHIFREAVRGQAVLFFDEADVLFGKRTEVKDAHDKYSNMEAAYLLQKMEEYPGVSVLATNLLQNFDEAFKRRIRFIIEFPFPDAPSRLLLWRSVFPARTPVAPDVDWDYLAAQFELSGSAIKNVAVNAAFLAAEAGEEVDMPHLLTALRREMGKSGKVLTREDFGEYRVMADQERWDYGGL